jgi:hypothetical protein
MPHISGPLLYDDGEWPVFVQLAAYDPLKLNGVEREYANLQAHGIFSFVKGTQRVGILRLVHPKLGSPWETMSKISPNDSYPPH